MGLERRQLPAQPRLRQIEAVRRARQRFKFCNLNEIADLSIETFHPFSSGPHSPTCAGNKFGHKTQFFEVSSQAKFLRDAHAKGSAGAPEEKQGAKHIEARPHYLDFMRM